MSHLCDSRFHWGSEVIYFCSFCSSVQGCRVICECLDYCIRGFRVHLCGSAFIYNDGHPTTVESGAMFMSLAGVKCEPVRRTSAVTPSTAAFCTPQGHVSASSRFSRGFQKAWSSGSSGSLGVPNLKTV